MGKEMMRMRLTRQLKITRAHKIRQGIYLVILLREAAIGGIQACKVPSRSNHRTALKDPPTRMRKGANLPMTRSISHSSGLKTAMTVSRRSWFSGWRVKTSLLWAKR